MRVWEEEINKHGTRRIRIPPGKNNAGGGERKRGGVPGGGRGWGIAARGAGEAAGPAAEGCPRPGGGWHRRTGVGRPGGAITWALRSRLPQPGVLRPLAPAARFSRTGPQPPRPAQRLGQWARSAGNERRALRPIKKRRPQDEPAPSSRRLALVAPPRRWSAARGRDGSVNDSRCNQ